MKTIALLLIALSADAGEPSASPMAQTAPAAKKTHSQLVEDLTESRDRAQSDIQRMQGKNICDGDGDCEVLEGGWRNCGGPTQYFIVSVQNKDYKTIKQRISEFTKHEKDLSTADAPLDCTPAPTLPEARCIDQKCKPKGKGGETATPRLPAPPPPETGGGY